jgi:L-asparaginase
VVLASRRPHGPVLDIYAYEGGGQQLKNLGVILGGMTTNHKARIKLMLLLGAGASPEEVKRSFERCA